MLKIINGDLIKLALAGEFDVIVHGCNCFNTMGAGIAKTIRQTFPEAYEADCKTVKGSKDKLGTYTSAVSKNVTIINAYTQHGYWGKNNPDLFEYKAFSKILKKLKTEFPGKRFGFPLIGCGLAGGDEDRIIGMLESQLADTENVTLVLFQPQSH